MAEQHKIDRNIALSGLYAAMHVAGVRRVELITPTTQLATASNEAAYNTNIDITVTND